jgi:SAM-dependent methyltransferase
MSARVKALLKPIMPAPVLELWQRHKFNLEQAEARHQPLEKVFTDIYEKRVWARSLDDVKYHSGPGSRPEVSRGYEDFVVAYLEQNPELKTLVDIGCGDFQVSNRILARFSQPIRYIGCDIAANVIAHNQELYGKSDVIEFRHLNAATDTLPRGDIITIREVFQHLSNATILAALANIRTQFKVAIITEAVFTNAKVPNIDLVSGYRTRDGLKSGVYLELSPFNLKILDRYEHRASDTKVMRTLVVEL